MCLIKTIHLSDRLGVAVGIKSRDYYAESNVGSLIKVDYIDTPYYCWPSIYDDSALMNSCTFRPMVKTFQIWRKVLNAF